MKKIYFLFITLSISNIACAQQKNDTLFVAHWNVENLFDTIDDPKTEDEEFLPSSEKEWNDERLDKKMYNLSRLIRSMNSDNGPDLLGVCEVEHQSLLDTMITKYLSDKFYKTAYLESLDGRGIDNGIIYDSNRFSLLGVKGHRVDLGDGYDTRFILEGMFLFEGQDTIYFFVNHWPSRRGGVLAGEDLRMKIANMIRVKVDSIINDTTAGARIIISGDFNSTPGDQEIAALISLNGTSESLINLSDSLADAGLGTYRYKGTWEMLDQILISHELLSCAHGTYTNSSQLMIFKPDFLLRKDPSYPGFSPFSTYRGFRYQGGYSDHLPVLLDLKIR